MNKTTAPKLRFPEFHDEWEKKPLKMVANVIAGQSPDGSNYNDRGIGMPFYQGKTDFGDVYINSPTKWTTQITKIAESGDILMSVRAPVGALNICVNQICIGRGLAAIQAKQNKWYLYYFLNRIQKSIVGNGGAIFDAINKDQIEDITTFIPAPSEQQKIADCLTSLDELIAAERVQLDALKAYKKGLLQVLFPAEGEQVPKLRFPEFQSAGEWEETTLGDLGTLILGLTYSPSDIRDDGLLVLRSSNIRDGVIVLDDCVYVTPDIRRANLSKPNDILICVRNGSTALIGKNAIIPEDMPLCTHGAFMTVFRAENSKFAYQLLQTKAYQSQVAAGLGARINSINNSQLLNYTFFVPTLPEQQKIAELLTSIDEEIAAQSQRLAGLGVHKQGLLQGLFP